MKIFTADYSVNEIFILVMLVTFIHFIILNLIF